MNHPVLPYIQAIENAKRFEEAAKQNRLSAIKAFALYTKWLMRENGMDAGTLRRRLRWDANKIGNFLHRDSCLKPDDMRSVILAISPLTTAEKKLVKGHTDRRKKNPHPDTL